MPGGKLIKMLEAYPRLYYDISAGSGWNALSRDPNLRENSLWNTRIVFYGRDYFDNIHQEFLNSLGLPAGGARKYITKMH